MGPVLIQASTVGSIDFDATVGGGISANSTVNDNLVWIDPKIWEMPTPTVQCFFPCTLVLPPLPAETLTTIDYPRIPVTSAGTVQGTLTFPPITVTEYALSTMIIPSGQSQANNKRAADDAQVTTQASNCDMYFICQALLIVAQPKLSTTTSWPENTWTDARGFAYTTQPAKDPLNFPPPNYQLNVPTLHVRNGAPSPTVTQCAFPALSCPTLDFRLSRKALWGNAFTRAIVKGPSPDNIQEHFWQGPIEIPDEDPDEPEQCDLPEDDQDENEDDDPDDPGEPDTPEPGPEPPAIPPVEPVIPPPGPFLPFPFPWAPLTLGNLTFSWTQSTPTKTAPPKTKTVITTRTLIPPTTRPKSSGTATKTVAFETPIRATPVETPDFSKKPKPSCYNKGLASSRAWMIKAIDSVCNQVNRRLSKLQTTDIGPGLFDPGRQRVDEEPIKGVYWDFTTTFEVKQGCVWKDYSFQDCATQFRRLVDECDTSGRDNKHGGVLDGNCVRWRLEMHVGVSDSK